MEESPRPPAELSASADHAKIASLIWFYVLSLGIGFLLFVAIVILVNLMYNDAARLVAGEEPQYVPRYTAAYAPGDKVSPEQMEEQRLAAEQAQREYDAARRVYSVKRAVPDAAITIAVFLVALSTLRFRNSRRVLSILVAFWLAAAVLMLEFLLKTATTLYQYYQQLVIYGILVIMIALMAASMYVVARRFGRT